MRLALEARLPPQMNRKVASGSVLNSDQIESYHDTGFLVVRDVIPSNEIRELCNAVDQAIGQRTASLRPGNLRARHKPHYLSGELLLEVVDPISDICPMAFELAQDPRIKGVVESIYGEPACLFKDKYFYKPPGATGLDLHQDWISWPGFPASFLTVLLAVDAFKEVSGCTMIYPGMHKQGYLSTRDGQHHHLRHDQMDSTPVALNLEPGDIAVFGCFTPHYSETNESSSTRRGYFISYNAKSEGGDSFESHYAQYHRWIRNRLPEPKRLEVFFE